MIRPRNARSDLPLPTPKGDSLNVSRLQMLPRSISVLSIVLAIACGGEDTDLTPAPASTQVAPESSPPPDVTAEPGQPDATGPLPELRLDRAFPSLSFARMTGLYQAPDGRFFVLEQAGRVLVFEGRQDVAQAQVFLDIRDRVDDSGGEMGLLGLALAPDFGQTGVFYLNYTAGNPRRTVVSRFTAPAPRAQADPASETTLLEVNQPFSNHNGGQTSFGPDGYLYIALGDGGGQRDPMRNGQVLGSLLGKILRIDVAGTGGNPPYRVPEDNPFAGREGARGEIWAYGFRNPWRFSFDSHTGQVWAGDVGQSSREEVDLVVKGGNYGWNIMEGMQCLSGGSCNRDGLILPVIDYPTAGGNCSVTGGFVYRGRSISSLRGAYVYGDYCGGHVWGIRYDGSQVTEEATLVGGAFPVSSFAQDNDGEIYALQYGNSGGIFKLAP